MLFVIASCSSTGDFSNPYGKAHEVLDPPSSQAGRCCWGWPKSQSKASEMAGYFCGFLRFCFVDFSFFPSSSKVLDNVVTEARCWSGL